MSVFTEVSREQLEPFIGGFALGRLIDFSGIAGGSENSNFFVACEGGEFVLTLIERGPQDELPFFVELLEQLRSAGLPVPYAIADGQGQRLHRLNGRPALLQPRLPGRHVEQPDASHCQAVGQMLARLHAATASGALQRRSDRGLLWMLGSGRQLRARLDQAQSAQLLDPLLAQIADWLAEPPALPTAILHADLFRDNVLFEGHHLTGLIDFYNAHTGWTLYDVAITVNDWCLDAQQRLQPELARALLAGYAAIRPFSAHEADLWPAVLRLAALRFWLSRQLAAEQHAGQSGVLVKDPEHFKRVLVGHAEVQVGLPLAL